MAPIATTKPVPPHRDPLTMPSSLFTPSLDPSALSTLMSFLNGPLPVYVTSILLCLVLNLLWCFYLAHRQRALYSNYPPRPPAAIAPYVSTRVWQSWRQSNAAVGLDRYHLLIAFRSYLITAAMVYVLYASTGLNDLLWMGMGKLAEKVGFDAWLVQLVGQRDVRRVVVGIAKPVTLFLIAAWMLIVSAVGGRGRVRS